MSETPAAPYRRWTLPILIGFALSAAFWLVDILIDALAFGEGTAYRQLWAPSPAEIWVRSFVSILLIGFSIYAAWTLRTSSQVQKTLADSEQRFRTLFETAAIAMALEDAEARIIETNESFRKLFDYSADELRGKSFSELTHPDDFEQGRNLSRELVDGARDQLRLERRYQRKDGALLYGALALSAIRDVDGNFLHGVAMIEDITERRAADEALQHGNRELASALAELKATQQQVVERERLSALGAMASGIAHDFNNSLAPIVGFCDLLQAAADDPDDRDNLPGYIEIISVAAQDAANVVKRLSEFYRLREDDDLMSPVDLTPLVERVLTLTQPRWKDQAQLEGKTIRVETELASDSVVSGNASELRELLINLIFNAVDAIPDDGTITIRSRVEDDQVTLEVADTGAGMTEDVRRRCFDPFFSTKGLEGSGLGLSTVFGTVQRHSASIDIESELGAGSTFRVRFPPPKNGAETKVERSPGAPSRPLHVLIVDDEPLVRSVLARLLELGGHSTEAATNGQEALEKFKPGRFDVVLTDRAMPGMNGDELAASIKETSPEQPIILLTGFGEIMMAADEKPAGVDLVLGKPVRLNDLRAALARVAN